MTEHLRFAASKIEVVTAYDLARARHTVTGCKIAAEPDHISWVSYLDADAEVTRLIYYPEI